MLATLRRRRPALRRSEQRVADAVAGDPQRALHSSVAELARAAGVSAPTVVRFYKALGCDSYQTFKLGLAQDLGRRGRGRVRYARRDLNDSTPTADLVAGVIDSALDSLQRLRARLDADALATAVRLLDDARRVDIYGPGGNAVVADDARLKLGRLGVAASAYADAYLHAVSAALLQPDDVVIAISNSGRNKDLLASVARATRAGAKVIAVTAAASPLARRADLTLTVDDPDAADDLFAPIRARLAPMVTIDALAIGLALARGPTALGRLETLKHALADKFVSV